MALSELAAEVQRGRKTDDVLDIAGQGAARLGMRFAAYQIDGDELLLRSLVTAPERLEAVERLVGCSLRSLRAPLASCAPVQQIIDARKNVYYRADLDLFDRFIRGATGHDPTPLESTPATAGIPNGVLTPLFIRERPWGLLVLVSHDFTSADAAAAALFATQVASAIEVAEYIEDLERTNAELHARSQELSWAQGELVKRERLAALGELSAIVAHEVRNPLAVIFNSVGALERMVRAQPCLESTPALDLVAILAEEARRLNGIVSELLDFARPAPLAMQSAALGSLVGDVVQAASGLPEAVGLSLGVQLSPGEPSIEMDTRSMRQALHNIVLNAIQASAPGDEIVVATRTELRGGRSFSCVDVVDSGAGVRPEDLPRIFEPFFTTKPTGTGLGLPLVKRVLDAHGGEVVVTPRTDGTTVSVCVPCMR